LSASKFPVFFPRTRDPSPYIESFPRLLREEITDLPVLQARFETHHEIRTQAGPARIKANVATEKGR
jgi:hypothetical protein